MNLKTFYFWTTLVWIHGRTRGSVNTSVQMEHSVISSSSFSVALWPAMLRPQGCDAIPHRDSPRRDFHRNESENGRTGISK